MLRSAELVSLPFRYLETGVTVDDTKMAIDFPGHATGDLGIFEIPFKCEVAGTALLIKEGTSDADIRVKFDKRPTAGSDTSRTDGTLGDIILGTSGASEAGAFVYDDAGAMTVLQPGHEVVAQLITTDSCTTGMAWPFLLVRQVPETMANWTNAQETE